MAFVIVALVVAVHPLASVTVTVYVPAATLLRSCVAAALLHVYVYPAVPPFTVKSIEPLLLPQVVFVCVVDNARGVGWVIVTLVVAVHPFKSVTVTV